MVKTIALIVASVALIGLYGWAIGSAQMTTVPNGSTKPGTFGFGTMNSTKAVPGTAGWREVEPETAPI